MSITFTCTGCGKQFQVPPEAAGRTVKCAGCGTKLRISGHTATGDAAKKPAMDLDWDLMQSASQPEPDVTVTAKPKDPNAVDWDAIAAPLSIESTDGTSPKMVRRKTAGFAAVDDSGQPLDATNNRFKQGRVDYFILEALMALPAGLTYLPQIFAIIMIGVGVGVIVGVMGLGFGFLLGKNPDPEPWLVMTMMIIVVSPFICFYGYVARFWTNVADEASEGNMGAALPNMGLGEMVRAIILWILFFVTYILPIVTIPLAPAAFLAMGRTNGYQAFNLPWVLRSSMRSWVHVLIALCFVPFFLAVGVIVASWVFPPVAQHALWVTKNLPPKAQDFYIGLTFQFIMVPVVMIFVASICRVIGLIGKFNPLIYESLPKRGRGLHGLIGGLAGVAIFYLITIPLISTQSNSVVMPMVRYVMGRAATQTREEARLNTQRPAPQPPVYSPPVAPPIATAPDLSKMNHVQLIQHHTSQIRSTDLNRSRTAMIWLASAQTVPSERAAVVRELEQALKGQYPDLALAALEKWSDTPLRVLLSRIQSPKGTVRLEAANVLATMQPEEATRAQVTETIARQIPITTHDDSILALLRAHEHWATDSWDVHVAELQRCRSSQFYIMEWLSNRKEPRAAKELVAHMGRGNGNASVASEFLRRMPAEAEVEIAITQVLGGDNARQVVAAAQLLAKIGKPESLPALRPLVTHQTEEVAKAARAAIRQLAPDEMTPAKEALLDLPLTDTRTSTRARAALEALMKMEPTDGDREAVIEALIKKLETIQIPQAGMITQVQMNAAFKNWADDAAMGRMLEQLDKQKGNTTIRRGLLSALGAMGNRKSIQAIVDFMENDPQAVSDTLIAMGRPAVEDTLLRVLRSGSEQTKLHIIRILEKIGGQNALPQLIALANADAANTTLRFPARTAVLAIQERLKNQK